VRFVVSHLGENRNTPEHPGLSMRTQNTPLRDGSAVFADPVAAAIRTTPWNFTRRAKRGYGVKTPNANRPLTPVPQAPPGAQKVRQREGDHPLTTPHSLKYGTRHQRLRKQYARVVATGTAVCARCGEVIEPDTAWDLGHSDFDSTVYAGPEHAWCNRSAGGKRNRLPLASQGRRQPVGELTESERGNFQDEEGRWWHRLHDGSWHAISQDW
jgi:hypothetical protein